MVFKQFSIHKNGGRNSSAVPYFAIIQNNHLNLNLVTTAVIPLQASGRYSGPAPSDLFPTFEVNDIDHLLITPQIIGIASEKIGQHVRDLSLDEQSRVLAALDRLFDRA